MRIEEAINRAIDDRLVAQNKLREELHNPSGKLSASKLGDPVQWQVLHVLGVPKKELDPYTLRKFLRGNDVENWLVDFIPGLVSKQLFLEYRDVVGYADCVVDTKGYDFKLGTIPLEIKSITNANYKWLKNGSSPNESHQLQAAFYGIAMGVEQVLLSYIASDDYRVRCFVIEVDDYRKKIDEIIDRYIEAKLAWEKDGVVPVFEPVEKWQKSKKYNPYPDFVGLSSREAGELARKLLKEVKKK